MVASPVVDDRGSVVARLIVRSVARCYDWSYDRSFGDTIAVIDRTIGRRSQRSVARCYDWSCDRSFTPRLIYDQPSGATIDRTLGHTMPRLLVRSVICSMPRLLVPSVAGCNHWSYPPSRLIVRSVVERNNWSYIGRWSLPLVARFPTMAPAIDILQSFVIARPRVETNHRMQSLLEIVANIADRLHLGPIATTRTIQKWYDPEIVRSGVTVALPAIINRKRSQIGLTWSYHQSCVVTPPVVDDRRSRSDKIDGATGRATYRLRLPPVLGHHGR